VATVGQRLRALSVLRLHLFELKSQLLELDRALDELSKSVQLGEPYCGYRLQALVRRSIEWNLSH
jgi:hypothetical protein